MSANEHPVGSPEGGDLVSVRKSSTGDHLEILVVEDSPTQAEELRLFLESHGHTVLVAADGRQALAIVGRKRPDLILSDIIMPEMDGYELCRRIKASPKLKGTPVVLLSSLSDPQDVMKGLACGADSFVSKPYEEHALLARIQETWQGAVTLRSTAEKVTLELFYEGQRHQVTANLVQSLNLLMATSAIAVRRYNELARAEQELIKANERLEQRVRERTSELAQEIRSHEEAERALMESEEKYRSMVASLSEGVLLQGADGAVLASNASAESILGESPHYPPYWNAIREDGSPFPLEEHPSLRVLKTGEPQSNVLMGILKPDRTRAWLSINARPVLRPGDDKPAAVVTSITDMTASRLTQERLRQQLYWTNVLNALYTAVAQRTGVDSILRVAMRHLEDSFSFELGAVGLLEAGARSPRLSILGARGRPLAERSGLREGEKIPVDQPVLMDGMQSLHATIVALEELGASMPNPESHRLREELGREGIGSVAVIPLVVQKVPYGAIFLFFKGVADFNEYERSFLHGMAESICLAVQNWKLYEDLDRAYDELKRTQISAMEQERLRAMGQMASGIAHDINNTLAPITLYTEALLSTESELSDRGRRFLQTIQQATRDIEGVIGRLRVFYARQAGAEDLKPIAVRGLLEHVVEVTRPRWKDMPQKQGVTIEVRIEAAEELPVLVVNEGEVREALINLVFNAVDAMERGGTLSLRARGGEGRLALEVEDTGSGMDEEQRRRCMEPFYTTKGERGSGLGLSMVYGVVQRHSGTMEIESSPGKGTIVRLAFPLRETTSHVRKEGGGQGRVSPLKILCIDDDDLVLESLKTALEIDGHTVQTAGSGALGVATFKGKAQTDEAFDLVITDLGMPHMDGHQVAREIKATGAATPVVLLSGWGNFIHINGERPEGVDRVLGKPPRIEELRATLRSIFEERASGART